MPFGSHPSLWPTKPDLGPKMVGLLVAALATYAPCHKWDLASLNGIILEDFDLGDGPLDSVRTVLGALVLVRKQLYWRR